MITLQERVAEVIERHHMLYHETDWEPDAATEIIRLVRKEEADHTVETTPVIDARRKYPTIVDDFVKKQEEQANLFANKMQDYGPGNISLGSAMETEDDINLSLKGLWFRMNDKINRLKQLIIKDNRPMVQGEQIRDTMQDLANYATIAQVVADGQWTEKKV